MEVKRSKWFKTLAAFLAFVMVIQILPLAVLADEIKDTPEEFVSEEQNFDVVDEVVTERTEYKKVYELSDGTFYEISSAAPIHENLGGEWVEPEIDAAEPATTKEAVERCDELAENVDQNDYGIMPFSIDINESETSGSSKVKYKILGKTDTTSTKYLNQNTCLIAQFPNVNLKDLYSTQVTINCKLMVNCKCLKNVNVYAYNVVNYDDTMLLKDEVEISDGILDYSSIKSLSNYAFDITSSYMKWEKGLAENNGIALTTTASNNITVNKCYITRQYKIIDLYDENFTYHTVDMGRAGKLYINDYTNTVSLVRDEIGIDGNIMPVELVRYFDFGHSYESYNPSGNGSFWNYGSYLTSITSYNYKWQCPDGSCVYFVPDSTKNTSGNYKYWVDADGNGYELELDTEQSDLFVNAKITTADSIIYIFGSAGKLTNITDKYNNSITVFYKSDDITQTNIYYIQDGQGRRYYFNYDDVRFDETTDQYEVLKSITIKAKNSLGKYTDIKIDGKSVTIEYEYTLLSDNTVALSKVIYPDQEFVTYTYDNNQLTEITNVDGRKITLDYTYIDSDSSEKNLYPCLTSYKEEVVNLDDENIITDKSNPDYNEYLLKSSLEIDNHNNYQRIITNNLNEKELIQYNENLRILYYDSPANTFYADYSKNPNGKEYLSQIVSPENGVNLLENSNFELGNEGWTTDQGEIIDGNLTGEGNKILRIQGEPDTKRIVYQDFEDSIQQGDIYVIGGWSEANTPIPTNSHFWSIEAHTFSENDEGKEIDNLVYQLKFDSTIDNEEQFRLGAFVIPEDAEYIEVQLVYNHQSGYADFDEIQLYKSNDDDVTFFNESEQNVEPAALSDEETTGDECSRTITNDKGLTTAEIVSNGNLSMVSQYEYNNNYYLKSATDNNNVKTEYEYDNTNGTLKSLKIGDKETVYSYTPVGALKEVTRAVSGLTDNVANISASYTYNHDRITSIAHNGIKYNLTYNSFGNVKKVDLEVLSDADNKNNLITYDYSKDFRQNLNSITYANGDVLSYTYDDNNNITEIYFKLHSESDSKLLYKYEYTDNNLSKIIDYDSNRITEYTSDGYNIFSFNPDNIEERNLIYSVKDTSTDESTAITHNDSLFGNEYTYTKYEDSVNTNNNETTYLSKYQFTLDNYKINMDSSSVSDYFGRAKSSRMSVYSPELNSEINADASIIMDNTYAYENYSTTYIDNGETINVPATKNLIKTFQSKIITQLKDENGNLLEVDENTPSNTFISSYDYDNCGRITHIYYAQNDENKQLVSYYKYDKSGQIIIDIDFISSIATQYSYDSGGNITSKKIYSGTEAFSFNKDNNDVIFTTPTETINYEYGNNENSTLNGFSDLLTSYNGYNIEYDEFGNPLNYYGSDLGNEDTNYQLEWQGTLLKSATTGDGNTKYVYSYDQNGLRTKKSTYSKSGDVWTIQNEIAYIWDDDLLVGYSINNGAVTIKMLYDEYQSPIGVTYISNEPLSEDNSDLLSSSYNVFWFAKDGQGNIIGMYSNVDGKSLGCHYDAYGKMTLDMNGTFMDEVAAEIQNAISKYGKWAPLVIALLIIGAAGALGTILTIDQVTYRGQIFDYETGLYYCQNRYYSPIWGRFISMDDPAQLTMNIEEPLNANLYAYCYNDPVNNFDPNGRSSYSFTGVGMQAEMSACLLSFAGEVGIELIYVWSKNALYAYYYYGGGAGAGYTNKAINYLSSSFKDIAMSSKVSLKNIANLFKLNYSISIGFFAAFTNKSFSWPNSYSSGYCTSNSISIGKWKGYKSTSSGCKTYGICYSPVGNSGFAFSRTTAKYNKITFNSSKVKSYLSSQKNNIKKAVS